MAFEETFESRLKQLKSNPLKIRIETSGGTQKRFEVLELQKDFLVTKEGEYIRYSHIGSFVDVSGELIK